MFLGERSLSEQKRHNDHAFTHLSFIQTQLRLVVLLPGCVICLSDQQQSGRHRNVANKEHHSIADSETTL